MATVTSKTSLKIDDLINDQIISGEVISNGHLILTTRGGALIDAGLVSEIQGNYRWDPEAPYAPNDIVGYAGAMWKAKVGTVGQVPPAYTSVWELLVPAPLDGWFYSDPRMLGNDTTVFELFWKSGTSTVSYTSTAGEFETGTQALKIVLGATSSQRVNAREENLVKGGELIEISVRAKTLSGSATLQPVLIQNDMANKPEIFKPGVSQTSAGTKTITSTWTTHKFYVEAVNGKPRAIVNLIFDSAAGASIVIDSILFSRFSGGLTLHRSQYRTTTQSIPNNIETILDFDVVELDQGIPYTAAGWELPRTGMYLMNAALQWPANTTGNRFMFLYRGSTVLAQQVIGGSAINAGQSISKIFHGNAGDIVNIRVIQNSTAALNVNGSASKYTRADLTFVGR